MGEVILSCFGNVWMATLQGTATLHGTALELSAQGRPWLGRCEGEGLRHGFRDLGGVREEGSQYDQNILHKCLKCSQREQLKLSTHRKKALVCRLSVADLSQRLASII